MNNKKRLKDTGSIVRDIFSVHPDWNARQIYDRYLMVIGDVNKAVTLNSIQKHVQAIKERYDKDKDLPWSLDKTPSLHAEAIGAIFKVRNVIPKWMILPPFLSDSDSRYYVIDKGQRLTTIPRHFTVREALWVARLYAVESLRKPIVLSKAVIVYSLLERLAELSGTPMDTSGVDEIIGSNKNVADMLEQYFQQQQISLETWYDLVNDIADIQENISKKKVRNERSHSTENKE